ncbi:steroid delta-isomerase [Halioglobus maricola]|uniref:Steroid delta-isomerase n=1 Tax=Halioglobus maricola TaxID=2601894 RepID=A0A5P9NHM8_9GAMM|nr:nuclear transport factor 2 family protein [Halioglobus maricola]QFU75039.1 steroid delta-isomerase [Halioglobus maricola]
MDYAEKVAVVNRYVEAFEKQDMAIIRDIYADNAVVEDPVGTDLHEGIEAVCAFYEGALSSGAKLAITGPVRSAANTAAFPFQVNMGEMSIDIIDVFEFDDQGKVVSMKAYWGPDNM